MILIGNRPIDVDSELSGFPQGSVELKILKILSDSSQKYVYDSLAELQFELELRREIINASYQLYQSRFSFRIFRDSICNPQFWERQNDGGFLLKQGVRPSEAIQDIFLNGDLYGTECATAMVIVYYKSLLNVIPAEQFDQLFPSIYLMNWHRIDPLLREVGLMQPATDFLPGDRRYFINPDVDPITPQWQGENVIDMGNGLFYGHGVGILNAQNIVEALNQNRKEDAQESAHLLDTAGRPNFKRLSDVYARGLAAA